jgi:hypothetical protein
VIFTNGLDEGLSMSDRNRDLASRIIDAVYEGPAGSMLPSPATAIANAAFPLRHSPLPAGAYPPGTYVCRATGEVLDIGARDGRMQVALMGMSLGTWEQREADVWRGMSSHLQVVMRAVRDPATDAAGIELHEFRPASACRFVAVEPARPTAKSAIQLDGWYYSDVLRTHYGIATTEGETHLTAAGNGILAGRWAIVQLTPGILRAGPLFLYPTHDPAGEVVGFKVSTGRVRNVPFRKVGSLPG